MLVLNTPATAKSGHLVAYVDSWCFYITSFTKVKTAGSQHGFEQRQNQMKCAPLTTAVEWKFEC